MTQVRPRGRGLIALLGAVSLALSALGLAAAPPAAAAATITGPTSGFVGQQQLIQINGYAPFCTVTLGLTFNNGTISLPVAGTTVVTDANGNASVPWTPASTGTATLLTLEGSTTQGVLCGSPISQPLSNVVISRVPTTTTISAPNTSVVGQPVTITVIVQSQSPSTYRPTGQVVVTNVNGAPVTSFGLSPFTGQGQSYAYWRFTPPTTGSFTFIATYQGDSNATGSTSNLDTLIATPSGNTISLSAPDTMTQGTPVTLSASVFPAGTQGSVGFTVNGQPISASIPLVNGVANFLWVPNVVGQITLGASYTTNQGGSGSTSQRVTVNPGPVQRDVISLVQPGVGPWNPNGVYTLPNGTSFTFAASTLSGAAVTLTDSGPCNLSGLTLTVDVGTGQCNIVASSPGGNGYAPVQQGYTVLASPGTQAPTFQPLPSGRVNKGRTIRLEAPGGSKTTAGQTINWRVTSGARNCQLRFPSNGAVNLRTVRNGNCEVRGTAPAVTGQWNRLQINRTYRVR